MKQILFLFALGASTISLYGQQLFGEVGRISTTFEYTNSDGESINNLYPTNNFSYRVGYKLLLSSKFNASGGLAYNRFGMSGSDPLYDNYYNWDAQYLGMVLNFDYDYLRKKRLILFARASIEPQFFLQGTQTINRQVFSLKGVEQFDKPFIFFYGSLGANYCIDDRVAFYGRYSLGKGSPFGQSSDDEVLKLNTNIISVGLIVSFTNCDYCLKKYFNN